MITVMDQVSELVTPLHPLGGGPGLIQGPALPSPWLQNTGGDLLLVPHTEGVDMMANCRGLPPPISDHQRIAHLNHGLFILPVAPHRLSEYTSSS